VDDCSGPGCENGKFFFREPKALKEKKASLGGKAGLFQEKGDKSGTLALIHASRMPDQKETANSNVNPEMGRPAESFLH